MKKLAKDLKPGDVPASQVSGHVVRVHEWDHEVDILFDGGSWWTCDRITEIEVKPRTIKASKVKPDMVIRVPGGSTDRLAVAVVVPNGKRVMLAGFAHETAGDERWENPCVDQECEVIE